LGCVGLRVVACGRVWSQVMRGRKARWFRASKRASTAPVPKIPHYSDCNPTSLCNRSGHLTWFHVFLFGPTYFALQIMTTNKFPTTTQVSFEKCGRTPWFRGGALAETHWFWNAQMIPQPDHIIFLDARWIPLDSAVTW